METYKGMIYQGEDYSDRLEVSNFGNVRNAKTKHVYKLHVNKNGYKQCCISLGGRDKKKVFKIHKAVAETFLSNPDNKPQVNHIDGNKLNNDIANLEWVTQSENLLHAYKNGLVPIRKGCDSPFCKFTQEDINFIKSNYISRSREYGTRALARRFNVSHESIRKVLNGSRYANN